MLLTAAALPARHRKMTFQSISSVARRKSPKTPVMQHQLEIEAIGVKLIDLPTKSSAAKADFKVTDP